MTLVAIHQPNFFPWLGYFDKIARADRFVFLDNVPMPLTGSSYVNRVAILSAGRAQPIQMPTARGGQARRTIATTVMATAPRWREKVLRTVAQSYTRAPFVDEALPVVAELLSNPDEVVGSFNVTAIRTIAGKLGIDVGKCVRASDLDVVGSSNDLLISVVHALRGDTYFAGGGAADYQQDELFTAARLSVAYQEFRHPHYPQSPGATFVSGLSVIDALMHLGFEGTRERLGWT